MGQSMTEAMIQIKDEIELKILLDGYWTDVPADRHYCFPCPHKEEGADHGFMIEPIVLGFYSSGKDYEEHSISCTGLMKDGSQCQAKAPYTIRRLRPRNA